MASYVLRVEHCNRFLLDYSPFWLLYKNLVTLNVLMHGKVTEEILIDLTTV